jgi:hypothetical protein
VGNTNRVGVPRGYLSSGRQVHFKVGSKWPTIWLNIRELELFKNYKKNFGIFYVIVEKIKNLAGFFGHFVKKKAKFLTINKYLVIVETVFG